MSLFAKINSSPLQAYIMTENRSKLKAEVTTVKIGHIEIEGLLLPSGEFAIAVPQICRLFSFPIKHSSRHFKALLGNDFSFPTCKTTLNSKPVNILRLADFERLVFELVLKQNELAIEFGRGLVGLSLHQLFSDAFEIELNEQDRQTWLKARLEGKVVRRTLTDAIKAYIESHPVSSHYAKHVYADVTDKINLGLFNRRANVLRKDWGCDNPRDAMTPHELRLVDDIENLATRLIDRDKLEPMKAVREAIARLCLPLINR